MSAQPSLAIAQGDTVSTALTLSWEACRALRELRPHGETAPYAERGPLQRESG